MQISVNDEPRAWESSRSLADLLQCLGAPAERVATVVNGEVVSAGNRAACRLQEGDRVEILTLAGGG